MFSKYRSRKTTINGVTFDSKKEAERYLDLLQMQSMGLISGLELQPEFLILERFRHEGRTERAIIYRADFRYIQNGRTVVEDVKGVRTEAYKIKRKMFLSQYGDKVQFREVS